MHESAFFSRRHHLLTLSVACATLCLGPMGHALAQGANAARPLDGVDRKFVEAAISQAHANAAARGEAICTATAGNALTPGGGARACCAALPASRAG